MKILLKKTTLAAVSGKYFRLRKKANGARKPISPRTHCAVVRTGFNIRICLRNA